MSGYDVISKGRVIYTSSPAEERILRYRTDDPEMLTANWLLFCADILGWKPKAFHQLYWGEEMLHNPYTLLCSVPRGGKTMCTEAVDLYEMCVNPNEDLRIYAPKLDQCRETLKYHYDWIDGSPILKEFLRRRNGKPIFSSDNYEFKNRSNAKCYTIMGKLEGHNTSIARVEEFDDWTWEKFSDDIMRRMGAETKNEQEKRMRITGTIQGQENIYRLLNDPVLSEMYHNLMECPRLGMRFDVHQLLAFGGVLNPKMVAAQKASMSPDEWRRSMLLQFAETKNYIWQKYIRASQKRSMLWGLYPEPYIRPGRYEKMPGETVGCGFDCGHAGQSAEASVFSLQIMSEFNTGLRKYSRWLNGFNWAPDVDPVLLQNEVVDILEYYQVDGGYGDALKHDIIAAINRIAYYRGLTRKNIDDCPDNTPANWDKWYISPMWNNDKGKHEMYSLLQHGIHSGELSIPYADPKDDRPEAVALRRLITQMKGIRQMKTNGSYPSYHAENKKLGDDDTDAAGMCKRWLAVNSTQRVNFDNVRMVGGRTFAY